MDHVRNFQTAEKSVATCGALALGAPPCLRQ